MRPFWLLETDGYGTALEPLKIEIRRQGMQFGIVHHQTFTSGYLTSVGDHSLVADDCIIFLGTWPLWRHIQLHWPGWIPGGWCATENLDCSAYYPRLVNHLVNGDHRILTGIEAIQRKTELFDRYGRDGQVFVRPDGCVKVFTGRCVDASAFDSAIAPARYDPATRIVVAPPRTIGREWRLIVAERVPIAASLYYNEGKSCLAENCPPEVSSFAQSVVRQSDWQPDDLFVMDICECDGELRVLELNGFSCAGLYRCNPAPIVATASRLALSAWKAQKEAT
jgi:hypothetical protein